MTTAHPAPHPVDDPQAARRPTVAFVCVHNAGRSQIAAALLRALAGDRVDVRSAGTRPAASINPVAAEILPEPCSEHLEVR